MSVVEFTQTQGRSRRELAAAGRALRKTVPRRSHARFAEAADRDPVALLRTQDAVRLTELVGVRYGRMLVSPFTYFRGAALGMAQDLRDTPATGIVVQACGDAHLLNFGAYASPERRLVFDLNDFDETHPGAWEWDVKRLAASFTIAARDVGLREDQAVEAAREVVRWYGRILARLSELSTLEIHYSRLELDEVRSILIERGDKANLRRTQALERSARRRTSEQVTRKLTETRPDGTVQIVEDPPRIVRDGHEIATRYAEIVEEYARSIGAHRAHLLSQYRFVDAALKVVGVGSVGLRAHVILLESITDGSPLMLQVKEAVPSVIAPRGSTLPDGVAQGRRVVAGQKLMQASSDPFLGWITLPDGDFYVRQMRDMKGSYEPEGDWSWFAGYAQVCGRALACAHARSLDPAFISGYIGRGERFADAVAQFATTYADRCEADWELLDRAARDGVIAVDREDGR
jgi:uncharacterized protein (DUF2252 family)